VEKHFLRKWILKAVENSYSHVKIHQNRPKKKRPLHINKGMLHQEETASVNIYIPNVGEPSFIK
jgi:hypothetical protein